MATVLMSLPSRVLITPVFTIITIIQGQGAQITKQAHAATPALKDTMTAIHLLEELLLEQ